MDVEAALASAQAGLGIIPADAAAKITACARLELLDQQRMAAEERRTGHSMVPLVSELARVVGPAHFGWVHWGATTQNIQQTGHVLALRIAHATLIHLLGEVLFALADLGERTAETAMAGRTHWQQAVPITFGFKVAAWSDVLARHLDRLRACAPRLMICMTGGAAGTLDTIGQQTPAAQDLVARRLGLHAMPVASRSIVDPIAELVCLLGMYAATSASIADEVARLMSTEFGEVSEPVPAGDVGSSTMPQKRNPKLCGGIVTTGARVRALVPLALEGMMQSHEVDGAKSALMEQTVEQACILSADGLRMLHTVIVGLEVFPRRMRANLDLSGGLISAGAVMMALRKQVGRQVAHEIVHEAANRVASGETNFVEALAADPRLARHVDRSTLTELLDPLTRVGLSAQIARAAAANARRVATVDSADIAAAPS